MQKDLSNYRKSYEKGALVENAIAENPIAQFETWFAEAEQSKAIAEPNAMTLSTAGSDSFPKGRVVLMKAFSEEGFIFYTNYESEKGKAIAENPKVCLSFFWQDLERQIIIKGVATKISSERSNAYFQKRPRKSQIGAYVSNQSEPIASRNILENRLQKVEEQYEDKEIPMPNDWGGYLVKPMSFEFWQGRRSRLHDRIRYSLEDSSNWKIERLQP